jgi:hypothetical protein
VVQESTLTQLPSGIALVGNVEDERKADDVSKESQPEKQTESPPFIILGNGISERVSERTGGCFSERVTGFPPKGRRNLGIVDR